MRKGAKAPSTPMKFHNRIWITPMGAVRMTQRSLWKDPAAKKYLDWKRSVAWLAKIAAFQFETGDHLLFKLPITRMKNPQQPGEPHTQKPDLDNLIKALFDALHKDDAPIYEISARKEWAKIGCIEVWKR